MEDKTEKGWSRIGGVISEKDPTSFYYVTINGLGHLKCSCKSWIFKKALADGSKPPCKHITALLNESLESSGFQSTLFGLSWLANRMAARFSKVS